MARIAPLICAGRPAGQRCALLMSRHAEASHGKQRRALGRGRRGGRRRGRGRACRGERGGRARGPCRPDREGREPRRQHGVVGRLDHGDGHAAPAPRRDRRQHGRALRGPRACSLAPKPIATTSRCAASSSTKHPRRSTGCCRPASSSPGPTPSRRTALRACTTCCRTRAPFRPRSARHCRRLGVDIRLGRSCRAAAGGGRPRAGRGGARRRWVHDCIQGEGRRGAGHRRLQRRPRDEGRARLRDGRQDRARQCAEHRRRSQAGIGGRRPHRQRRHRARAEAALRAAGARQPGAAAAAVARRRPRRQIRGRAPARLLCCARC